MSGMSVALSGQFVTVRMRITKANETKISIATLITRLPIAIHHHVANEFQNVHRQV
ncbi:MAG: hypothetical protein ACI9T7_002090 [Oleiphilaceae bacterium]|jgi:hypothetical protein